MKNREKYTEEILDIACSGNRVAIRKDNKRLTTCEEICCCDCCFGDYVPCEEAVCEWAESEYVEQVKISKKDRAFLDYLKDKLEYMTRDKVGCLSVYIGKPRKDERFGIWCDVARSTLPNSLKLLELNFPMVKWSDAEPWKIEDLKKLEACDEYGEA